MSQSITKDMKYRQSLTKNAEKYGVACSLREDQKRFYSCHAFYSLDDFAKQFAVRNRRSNSLPMKPLRWRSPSEVVVQYV